MTLIQRGKVEHGAIVLPEPLRLPDGTEVVVTVDPVSDGASAAGVEELTSLPFFGLWKNREEMSDSAVWVRERRQQWQRRAARA